MGKFLENHKDFWSRADFVISAVTGVLFLLLSLVINWYAGMYAAINASNSVTDIILKNIPVMNVEFIFTEGMFIFVAFVAVLLIMEPKRIPFGVKSIALFVIIRSIFISLTHLGPSPDSLMILDGSLMNKFTFGSDLFFSGHTGLPFLMALLFWNHKYLRISFIAASLIFGSAVLLGHLHYSIDVFAAFFITDGIFRIAEKVFAKDYRLFLSTLGIGSSKITNNGQPTIPTPKRVGTPTESVGADN